MQFKVPQFLDIEDKIFGPFTFREFVYLAGGAGLCFVIYKTVGLIFGLIPILAIAGFVAALTFYKPNNKPFIYMLESGFKYFTQDKLYIWKRQKKQTTNTPEQLLEKTDKIIEMGQRLNSSKLKDLAWSLNVLDLSKEKNNTQ